MVSEDEFHSSYSENDSFFYDETDDDFDGIQDDVGEDEDFNQYDEFSED